MPIRWKIREKAMEHGIKTATDFMFAVRMSAGGANALWNERTTRVDFETLERLCQTFNCDVADLLEYVPEAKELKK
jgi:putative transcriptional regulator